VNVSRETEARLETFKDLLAHWTTRINLVSRTTLDDIWHRHILDSAQLLHRAPDDWVRWADLGTGGGLPGVVIAILARELAGPREIVLVESDARKAAFLRTALREVGAEATVLNQRIEATAPLAADVVSARALAPLPRLLGLAAPHLADGGIALFPKGRNADAELQEALDCWTFACEKIPSDTDPEAVILKIGDLKRV